MVAGVEDDGRLLVELADVLTQLGARAVGETAVEQVEVEAAAARQCQPLLHVLRRHHPVPQRAEQVRDEETRVLVVVYEKDAGAVAQRRTPMTGFGGFAAASRAGFARRSCFEKI